MHRQARSHICFRYFHFREFFVAHPAQRRWYPLVFVIAALVLLPLSVLLLSWQSIDAQIWSHL